MIITRGMGLGALLCASFAACGGKAIIDPEIEEGQGGAGGTGVTSVTSSTSAVSVAVSTSVSTSTTTTTTTSTTTSSSTGVGGAPPPDFPPLVEIDAGTVASGNVATATIPSTAIGITAIARSQSFGGTTTFTSVVAPDMTLLVQNGAVVGTASNYEFVGSSVATVPQSDVPQANPPLPGLWSFTPGGGGLFDVSVWYRQTVDAQFHGGALDVNVFSVPNVASQAYLDQLVDQAFEGFAGLTVGTVNHFALPASYSVVTDANAFPLLQETQGAPGKPVLNLLAVSFIDLPGQPIGFSPGAPGNPLENGTFQSGVVMAVDGNDLALDVGVLRHEAGHFAGLFHTSEITGGNDAYADTPQCSDVLNQGPNCPDFENLMFPFANPFSMLDTSPSQEATVRGSALYRGAVEPGGGFAPPLSPLLPPLSPVAPAGAGAVALGTGALGTGAALPGSWGAMPPAARMMLDGIWCGTTGDDLYGALAATGVTPAELLAAASEPQLRPAARARALLAAPEVDPAFTAVSATLARDLAVDVATPRTVRVAALRHLHHHAPALLAKTRPLVAGEALLDRVAAP